MPWGFLESLDFFFSIMLCNHCHETLIKICPNQSLRLISVLVLGLLPKFECNPYELMSGTASQVPALAHS